MEAKMLILQRREQEEILRLKEQLKFSLFCWILLHMGHAVNSSKSKRVENSDLVWLGAW